LRHGDVPEGIAAFVHLLDAAYDLLSSDQITLAHGDNSDRSEGRRSNRLSLVHPRDRGERIVDPPGPGLMGRHGPEGVTGTKPTPALFFGFLKS